MLHGVGQRGPGDLGAAVPARSGRSRQLGYEFAKFGVIGVAGIFITNGIYDLLFIHLGIGPVTSTTIATVVATIASYLGNRYLLHLGHNEVAGLVALNAGIALATLFRFWSYRRFVWVTPRGDS